MYITIIYIHVNIVCYLLFMVYYIRELYTEWLIIYNIYLMSIVAINVAIGPVDKRLYYRTIFLMLV